MRVVGVNTCRFLLITSVIAGTIGCEREKKVPSVRTSAFDEKIDKQQEEIDKLNPTKQTREMGDLLGKMREGVGEIDVRMRKWAQDPKVLKDPARLCILGSFLKSGLLSLEGENGVVLAKAKACVDEADALKLGLEGALTDADWRSFQDVHAGPFLTVAKRLPPLSLNEHPCSEAQVKALRDAFGLLGIARVTPSLGEWIEGKNSAHDAAAINKVHTLLTTDQRFRRFRPLASTYYQRADAYPDLSYMAKFEEENLRRAGVVGEGAIRKLAIKALRVGPDCLVGSPTVKPTLAELLELDVLKELAPRILAGVVGDGVQNYKAMPSAYRYLGSDYSTLSSYVERAEFKLTPTHVLLLWREAPTTKPVVIGSMALDPSKTYGAPRRAAAAAKVLHTVAPLPFPSQSPKVGTKPLVLTRAVVDSHLGEGFSTIIQEARLVPNSLDGATMRGFKIFAISEGSLLAQVGLQNGDVILAVNGTELSQPEQGFDLFEAFRSQKVVAIDVMRGTETRRLSVKIK